MAKAQKIKLNDLLVNTENYRFEPVASQKEAIDYMIEDQKIKLFNLASHIIENGLNPNDKIQVAISSHDNKKYIVLEGNRRIISLKILNSPDLIEDPICDFLKKKFKQLNDKHKLKIPKEIECIVYDNPSEADRWIKLKHGGQSDGIGTVDWNGQQVGRFEEKTEGKSSVALQVIKKLSNSLDVPDDVKKQVAKVKITNLDRLISDPDVRSMLGIEIDNGILKSDLEEKEVIKGLIQVIKDITAKGFGVSKIYSKEDREDYIEKFPEASKPIQSSKATKPWVFSEQSLPLTDPPKPKAKVNPVARKKLIPKECKMRIVNPKVNAIYHELLSIDITKHTNAVAVLLRVFIELSTDTYLEAHSIVTTPSATRSGLDFQQKVNQVAQHLEAKKMADSAICKGIKASIKDKNDILGIDTWHAYVHNNKFSPKSDNLIITWDNIQDFMIILWKNI